MDTPSLCELAESEGHELRKAVTDARERLHASFAKLATEGEPESHIATGANPVASPALSAARG